MTTLAFLVSKNAAQYVLSMSFLFSFLLLTSAWVNGYFKTFKDVLIIMGEVVVRSVLLSCILYCILHFALSP